MANKEWRTSYLNHLVKLAKGEEPSALAMSSHYAEGKGHTLAHLIEYMLSRSATWTSPNLVK